MSLLLEEAFKQLNKLDEDVEKLSNGEFKFGDDNFNFKFWIEVDDIDSDGIPRRTDSKSTIDASCNFLAGIVTEINGEPFDVDENDLQTSIICDAMAYIDIDGENCTSIESCGRIDWNETEVYSLFANDIDYDEIEFRWDFVSRNLHPENAEDKDIIEKLDKVCAILNDAAKHQGQNREFFNELFEPVDKQIAEEVEEIEFYSEPDYADYYY